MKKSNKHHKDISGASSQHEHSELPFIMAPRPHAAAPSFVLTEINQDKILDYMRVAKTMIGAGLDDAAHRLILGLGSKFKLANSVVVYDILVKIYEDLEQSTKVQYWTQRKLEHLGIANKVEA